jgi:TadE-like protein
MRTTRKQLLLKDRGQAMVEFVLSIIFIMTLLLWAVELILFIYTYSVMADAAKEGVRYAIVHGSNNSLPSGPSSGATSDCTTNVSVVKDVVKLYAKFSFRDTSGSNLTVNVCYLDGNNQSPNRVQVTLSYPYLPLFSSLGWSSPTVKAAAEGRIVN